MERTLRGSLAVLAALTLAACVGQPVRQAPPVAAAAAIATQEARETALRADRDWGLAGRVALANGDRGGSGRMDWRQSGERTSVSLSAPITRQSWRLDAWPGGATLAGLEGGPRHGPDPADLLRQSTGWEIPVTALPAWLRGLRAEDQGAAALEFGADGRLARMQQAGWTITYSDWRMPEAAGAAAPSADGVALPHRLEAVRGEARVRLVVDGWGPGADGS